MSERELEVRTVPSSFQTMRHAPENVGVTQSYNRDGSKGRRFLSMTFLFKGALSGFPRFLSQVSEDLERFGMVLGSVDTKAGGLKRSPGNEKRDTSGEWSAYVECWVRPAVEIDELETWWNEVLEGFRQTGKL